MRGAAYLRVSTGDQVSEGYSLAAQERAIRAFCEAHSWELVEVYADEGRSGSSIDGRDELKRLLADAGNRQFERVIFLKLDRLGRSLKDLLTICDDLESVDVGIVSIEESIDTGTAAGRMMRSILGSIAEFEREQITSRIRLGIEQKARGGELVGPLPLGYQRDEAGSAVLDAARAPLIQEVFALYATGRYSMLDLSRWAVEKGLRGKTGNVLSRAFIRDLLINSAYKGIVSFHGGAGADFEVEGQHPALVDAATFEKVQATLRRRRRSSPEARRPFGRRPYPLSGIAKCGYDDAPLCGQLASGGKQRYLRCSTTARRGRDACQQPMVRADVVEQQFAEYVGHMRLPPEILGAVVQELRRRQEKPAHDPGDVVRAERQMERWKRLFVIGDIDEARYREEVAPLREQASEMEPSVETVDAERALQHLRSVGALWSESPRDQQRAFVREVFESMELRGPQLTAITPQAQYAPFFVFDRLERFGGEMGSVGADVLVGE